MSRHAGGQHPASRRASRVASAAPGRPGRRPRPWRRPRPGSGRGSSARGARSAARCGAPRPAARTRSARRGRALRPGCRARSPRNPAGRRRSDPGRRRSRRRRRARRGGPTCCSPSGCGRSTVSWAARGSCSPPPSRTPAATRPVGAAAQPAPRNRRPRARRGRRTARVSRATRPESAAASSSRKSTISPVVRRDAGVPGAGQAARTGVGRRPTGPARAAGAGSSRASLWSMTTTISSTGCCWARTEATAASS